MIASDIVVPAWYACVKPQLVALPARERADIFMFVSADFVSAQTEGGFCSPNGLLDKS